MSDEVAGGPFTAPSLSFPEVLVSEFDPSALFRQSSPYPPSPPPKDPTVMAVSSVSSSLSDSAEALSSALLSMVSTPPSTPPRGAEEAVVVVGSGVEGDEGGRVRFGMVEVRFYASALGDHPSVSCGVPVGLLDDWLPGQTCSLNEYEQLKAWWQGDDETATAKDIVPVGSAAPLRRQRRGNPKKVPCRLTEYQRLQRCLEAGHSKEEILSTMQQVQQIQEQRISTIQATFNGADEWEWRLHVAQEVLSSLAATSTNAAYAWGKRLFFADDSQAASEESWLFSSSSSGPSSTPACPGTPSSTSCSGSPSGSPPGSLPDVPGPRGTVTDEASSTWSTMASGLSSWLAPLAEGLAPRKGESNFYYP